MLHRAAYAQLGLDWTYDAIEVDSAGLAGFLAGCGPEWAGLSLTMPLKRAVLPLLASASELVDVVGGANTVVFGPEGMVGHNTDVLGIIEALRGIGAQPGPAMVLGGGATAASALAALARMGCPSVTVRARRPEAAADLVGVAERLGVELEITSWPDRLPSRDEASIVVCTVPAAAGAGLAGRSSRRTGVVAGRLVLTVAAGSGRRLGRRGRSGCRRRRDAAPSGCRAGPAHDRTGSRRRDHAPRLER